MREKEDRAVAPLIDSIKWRIDYAGGRTVAIRVLLTDKDDSFINVERNVFESTSG